LRKVSGQIRDKNTELTNKRSSFFSVSSSQRFWVR